MNQNFIPFYCWIFLCINIPDCTASLLAQMVKNPPAMWETWVQSLGGEDLLEGQMDTHSIILAWRILWTEEPGGLQSMGSQRVGWDWATSTQIPHCADQFISWWTYRLFPLLWIICHTQVFMWMYVFIYFDIYLGVESSFDCIWPNLIFLINTPSIVFSFTK